MAFWNFIKYCFTCMMNCFSAAFGHVPENFTWKEILTGIATLLIILGLIFLIIWLISLICRKK